MVRKHFLLITIAAVLCVAILTVPAGAAPAEHFTAAKTGQPSDVVQGNVYLITGSTFITALNATTGALLWQFQPGGYVDPPDVVKDTVYTLVLNGGSTTLYALNETTGATRWTFQPSGLLNVPVISNAVYVTADSLTSNSSTLYALNPTSGATLWSFQPGTFLRTPLISQNIVYVSTVYSTSIYALTASKGKLLWHSQPLAYSFSIGTIANGILYGDSEGPKYSFGILYAYSTHDGSFLWSFQGSLWAEGHSTTYVEGGTIANPTICGLNDSDGSQRWCTPGFAVTLAGGLVYVTAGQSAFQVYSDSNGSLLWSRTNAGFLAAVQGVVYAVDTNNFLEALKAGNGSMLWSRANVRFLTAVQGVVYAVDNNNFIEALKTSDGSLRWQSQTAYGVGSYFSVVDGLLIIASADNLSVYALKANSGALQWRYQLPGALFSVSVSHGVVYVTTLAGTIYALKVSNGTLLWKH